MNILFKLIPFILIGIIFYVLFNSLYPRYQVLLNLAKQLNELRNREEKIDALTKLKTSLNLNPNIKTLLDNQSTFMLWIPESPKIEELIVYLDNIYQSNGLRFPGVSFNIIPTPKVLNPNVLPLKVISFNLSVSMPETNLMNFIQSIENNVRIMNIKKARITPGGNADFEVETYYLSEE